ANVLRPHEGDGSAPRGISAHHVWASVTEDSALLSRQAAHRHREGGHRSVGLPVPREPADPGGLPPVPNPAPRPFREPALVEASSACAAAVQKGRGALQGGRPRGTLGSAESEREQGLWRRTFVNARSKAATWEIRPIA